MEQQERFFADSSVVVTGGAGSVGEYLVGCLHRLPVRRIRVIDNNEMGLFQLAERYSGDDRVETLLTDVRSESEVQRVFAGMDVGFHLAALKHVFLGEKSPLTVVQTNIQGVQSVINASISARLRAVVFSSSDKAVNPTSVLGASKLMGERLFTASNWLTPSAERCLLTSCRFGNVAGSRGSVVPLFCQQIATGLPLTLTDERMTRFVMTPGDTADLLLDSMMLSIGGEVFISKMSTVRIADLARVMIRLIAPKFGRKPEDVEVRVIGARPGEKLWEELNTDEEVGHTLDLGRYFVVTPALRNLFAAPAYTYPGTSSNAVKTAYRSDRERPLTPSEIERFLQQPGVLTPEVRTRLGLE